MPPDPLTAMNGLLASLDDELTREFESPKGLVAILAPPRSGSTLLQQVLVSNLHVGYVSNLMAKLWRAPFLGARLAKELESSDYESTYRSKFGNTVGAYEPHEWGWFWRDVLGLQGGEHYVTRPVNARRICQKLAAVESVLGRPFLVDSVFVVANLALVRSVVPQLCAIDLRRHPYWVANSILNARIERYGSVHEFYGHPPRNVSTIRALEDPVEQVVAQTRSIFDELDAGLSALPAEDVLRVNYETLRAAPASVVDAFVSFAARHGSEPAVRVRRTPRFEDRNSRSLIRPEYREALDRHFARYFEGTEVPSDREARR